MAKYLPAKVGYTGSIPRLGRSPRERQPASVFLSGKSHGQRRLAGYNSPLGRKRAGHNSVIQQQLSVKTYTVCNRLKCET